MPFASKGLRSTRLARPPRLKRCTGRHLRIGALAWLACAGLPLLLAAGCDDERLPRFANPRSPPDAAADAAPADEDAGQPAAIR